MIFVYPKHLLLNLAGKYFVRLFWLGSWRKIIVDDFLPIDVTGHVLLPSLRIPRKPSRTSNVGVPVETKEKDKQSKRQEPETPQPTVVLWPFLLAKALLKVANLTMMKEEELVDFNIVHCLTGWVVQKLNLEGEFHNSFERFLDSRIMKFVKTEHNLSNLHRHTSGGRMGNLQELHENVLLG